jgi:hypothetical protein
MQSAAIAKGSQLIPDVPNAILVGLDQLADQDRLDFLITLDKGTYVAPEDLPIQWSTLPANIKYILMCEFTPKRTSAWVGRWMTNPACQLPGPPGAIDLLTALFPRRYFD